MFPKKLPPKTNNIDVKYPDLAVPEILLKFFKLTCGTDFAQGPPVCNPWPTCSVLVMPALPTLSWSLRKDLPERGLALLPEPSSCSKAIGCAKSQSEHRNGGGGVGRVGGGGEGAPGKGESRWAAVKPHQQQVYGIDGF